MTKRQIFLTGLLLTIIFLAGCAKQGSAEELVNVVVELPESEELYSVVLNNLTQACPLEGVGLTVVESEEINAFSALEESEIIITTAMLDIIGDSEGQLAFVLGHEIGHLSLWNEDIDENNVIDFVSEFTGTEVLELILKVEEFNLRSQFLEYIADGIAIECMQETGYDALDAGAFFGKMQLKFGTTDPTLRAQFPFLDTHPYFEDRIENIRNVLFLTESEEGDLTSEEFSCMQLGCPRGMLLVGSINSNVYHECNCGSALQIHQKNLVCFPSLEQAKEVGYRAAKKC